MGSFNKKTLKDIDLKDKRVLLRADYNVPMSMGKIADDYRIRQSLPTIRYIVDQGSQSLVIISHLGRPSGPTDKIYSLAPVAKRLSELLGQSVVFAADCIGQLPQAKIILCENLRFHPEEEKNDPAFARQLVDSSKADVFVQDGFGVVHRAHASTEAITHYVRSVAGLLLAREVETISSAMNNPTRPMMAIVGGAKIADKIDVLKRFVQIADCVAVGGALANDFLVVEKVGVGKSLVDKDALHMAEEVLSSARRAEKDRNFNLLLPTDVVVSVSADGRNPTRIVDISSFTVADIESYPKKPAARSFSVGTEEMILDLGPVSAGVFAGAARMSNTIIWSGPLGITEVKGLAGAHAPFEHGTRTVVEAIIGASNQHAHKPLSIVGGGDTVSYVQSHGIVEDFSHVSTGGSASLELMAGHKLPGVDSLETK